jgi:hypothetical protein
VGVGLYAAVKPLLAVYYPHGHSGTFPQKQADIPVHRPQRQAGYPGFKLVVYPLGAGMGRGGLYGLQYRVPLFAVLFSAFLHVPSKSIIVTIIKILHKSVLRKSFFTIFKIYSFGDIIGNISVRPPWRSALYDIDIFEEMVYHNAFSFG